VDGTHLEIAGNIHPDRSTNDWREVTTPIKKWRGFPSSLDPLRDCNGRGTGITSVILRTVPGAVLYIARVFDDAHQLSKYEEVVEGLFHIYPIYNVRHSSGFSKNKLT
jgi:hypothetical protein